MLRKGRFQEEGEYEWATYHNGGGKEGAHAEPAVLYTPLGGGNEDDGFEDEWRRIFIAGSRCEQYGGHWEGHKCVGIRSHGHGHVSVKDVACTIAGRRRWRAARRAGGSRSWRSMYRHMAVKGLL